MPETVRVKCTIQKQDVLILNSIIDSHESIGLVRTVDAKNGSMVIYATDGTYKTVLRVLEELKKDGMDIQNISWEVSESVDEW